MIEQTQVISSNSKDLEQKVKYQNISQKLNELKNIIKGTEKDNDNDNKKTIFEYILYPEIISINELKKKIFEIFDVKNNDKLFSFLLAQIDNLFKNDEQNNDDKNEKIELRSSFYKILENLNYYISYSLIYYTNKNKKKNKPLEFFQNWIINDSIVTKSVISSYINIFNLKNILTDFYSLNKKENSKIFLPYNSGFLYMVNALKLQNIYKYKSFFTELNKRFINQNYIYDLYCTYNTSLKEIYDLTDFLISIKINCISSLITAKILNENDTKNQIDNHVKKLLIEKLMINYSFIENIKNDKIDLINEFIMYYSILSENLNIISNDYKISWSALNSILKYYLSNKEFDKSITLLNSIKNINIINKYIDNNLIVNLAISIPVKKT